MRALVLAVLAALFSSQASADISWQTVRMAPGSLMVMEDERGAVTSHVARGQAGGLFRFDTYEGRGQRAVFVGSYYTNDRGEVVRSLSVDGGLTRYEPHRCARTVGVCDYVIVHPDGFRESRKRVSRETALGVAWKEWGLDGLVATGGIELDKIGAARKSWRRDHQSGRQTRSKRIMMAVR